MYDSFISVVIPASRDFDALRKILKSTARLLQENFRDFEIILINAIIHDDPMPLREAILPLGGDILKNVYILNFSSQNGFEEAILGGLDNAHGDYVILLEMASLQTDLILHLFREAQLNYDLVYLQYRTMHNTWFRKNLRKIFYYIFNKFSKLNIHPGTHINRIISRRALNQLLMNRSDWHFLKASLTESGFPASRIFLNGPMKAPNKSIYEQLRLAVLILMTRTTLLNSLFIYLLISSFIFSLLVILNALLVRYTGHDILGDQQVYVPGWAFIVVFLSVTFNIFLMISYFFYVYLTNIFDQVRKKPLYTIVSVDKF